jgi:hypothetical protein
VRPAGVGRAWRPTSGMLARAGCPGPLSTVVEVVRKRRSRKVWDAVVQVVLTEMKGPPTRVAETRLGLPAGRVAGRPLRDFGPTWW